MLDFPAVVAAQEPLTVAVHEQDGRTVLTASGEVDLLTAATLERPLEDALTAREPLLLDLSGVSFIDSTGLRLLLEARNRAARPGAGGLALRLGDGGRVRRLLDLTGVLGLFTLEG
jgi:anti-anti-sigma factor